MIRLPAILLAFVLAAFSQEAVAHASLVSSEPRDGAVVETVPERLMLTFNEAVTPLVLRLISPGGMVLKPEAEADGNRVVVALPPGLPRGTQALSWRVASGDGHPIAGSVLFSIGAPSDEAGLEAAATAPGIAPVIWLGRALIYLGLFVGVGGMVFGAWLMPSGHLPGAARSAALATLALGLLAVPASLGLQGLDALGLGLAGLADPDAWRAGWATAYGATAVLAAFAMAAALLAAIFAGSPARALALASLVATGLALAMSGHASAAEPQWLMRPAVFVHAVGVALWVGALVPLAVLMSSPSAEGRAALMRFSATIPLAVAALIIAGIALAIVQLEAPAALWSTGYGRILAIKLVLVMALLGLAAHNRFRLTRQVENGDAAATRKMRRAIGDEILLAVAILGLVALWRFTPPPRSEAAAIALRSAVSLHLHDADTMANVTITPGNAGPVTIEVAAFDTGLQPLAPKEVTVFLSNPAAGIEPIRRVATRSATGAWTAEATLPSPGEWRVRVDLLVTDFRKVTLEDEVRIR